MPRESASRVAESASGVAESASGVAEIGRRAFAYLIDLAIAAGLVLVLSGVFFGIVVINAASSDRGTVALGILLASAAVALASTAWGIAYTVMQGGAGSIGQRAVGIRLADATTGASIGFWRALLRNIVWLASTAILVGYVTPLLDGTRQRRGWHDLAARNVVVDRTRRAMASAPPVAPPKSDGVTAIGRDAAPGPEPVTSPGLGVPRGATAPGGFPGRPRSAAPGDVISFVPGVTADAANAAPAPLRASAPPQRETAVATPPVLQTVARAPEPQTRATAAPWASLTWDDGTRIGVYGPTLFGRNPAPQTGATAFALRDETLSLSKTHFEIGGDADGVWIADRHSTNGTAVVRDGERTRLVAGERMPLHAGDRLEFGDRSARVGGAG